MYILPANDVTSIDIDTAVATEILFNYVYISYYKQTCDCPKYLNTLFFLKIAKTKADE